MANVYNTDKTVDVRDIRALLESLKDEVQQQYDDWRGETNEDAELQQLHNEANVLPYGSLDEFIERNPTDSEEVTELRELRAIEDDLPSDGTLIHDDHFEDYARELAEDIGAINKDMQWPCNCIDWKQAAEELQQDFTSLEWGGSTYWYRS